MTVPKTAVGDALKSDLSLLTMLRTKPVFFIIYGLMLLTNVMLYAIVVYLPQLLEVFEVTEPLIISIFLAAAALSAGTVAFFYARVRSRFSYHKMTVLTFFCWSIGFIMIS